MKNILVSMILAVGMMFASPVFAQEAAAEANHAAAVEAAKAEAVKTKPAPVSAQTQQTTNEWVGVAAGLGDALATTAQKLNIELQDFAKSPLGIVTIALIIYHYAGDSIGVWLSAFVWLFFAGGITFWSAKKTCGEYNEKGKFVKFVWWDGKGDFPAAALIHAAAAITTFIVFAAKLP